MMRGFFSAGMVLVFAIGTARGEWDTYQGDANHSGYISVTENPSQFSIAWQRQLPATALSGMAVGGGNVYVSNGEMDIPDGTPSFFALNEQTGSTSWTAGFSATSAIDTVFSVNAPAYSNGMAYVQITNNEYGTKLYAFNSSTGASAYVAPFTSQWERYLSPTPYDGSIYMDGGTYGGMYSFSATSNAQNWFFYGLPQFDSWTPAVSGGTAYAYVGSGVFAVNTSTGTQQYFINDPNAVPTYYSMHEAIALGSSNDGFVTNNGRLLAYSLLSDATHTPQIKWINTDHFFGQVTVAQGMLYAADGLKLQAVTESNGANSWSFTPPDSEAILDNIIATNNELFFSTSNDTYAVNLSTHAMDWSLPVSGNLALSDQMLFISSADGVVTAVNLVPEPASAAAILVLWLVMHRCPRAKRGL